MFASAAPCRAFAKNEQAGIGFAVLANGFGFCANISVRRFGMRLALPRQNRAIKFVALLLRGDLKRFDTAIEKERELRMNRIGKNGYDVSGAGTNLRWHAPEFGRILFRTFSFLVEGTERFTDGVFEFG